MSARFQLLDEPWIPVERLDGSFAEVSLLEAFQDAASLRRIVDPSPLVTVALYRFLFAIFHRAVQINDSNDWLDKWDEADAHLEVGEYLEVWRHRFDLFDQEAPFWQVPDLTRELGTMSWAKLAAELNDNNNKVLFDHTQTKGNAPSTAPAEVARLLIACQMFSVGAGNSPTGYNVNAVLATSLVVVPEADSLRDTLLANARERRSDDDGPIWEQPIPRAQDIIDANSRKPVRTYPYVGLTSRMTWLTRAIRIEPPGESGLVSSIVFGAGRRPEVAEGARDPWVAYRVSSEGKWVPQRLSPTRAVWRDLQSIVLRTDDEHDAAAVLRDLGELADSDRPFPLAWTLLLGGQAADKAKLEGWGQERWRLPGVALRGGDVARVMRSAAPQAEDAAGKLRGHLSTLARHLLTTSRDNSPDKKAVWAMADSLPAAAMYWSSLERDFAVLLRDLTTTPDSVEGAVVLANANWHHAIGRAISEAQQAARQSIGSDARAQRAWAIVGPRLDQLRRTYEHKARELEGGLE